jgi:hypothetical protein
MDPPPFAALVAATIVLGGWAAIAAVLAVLAQLRMRAVEKTHEGPALPADDQALLWYAVASLVWLSGAVVAVVGLARRDWVRLGRNATLLFLVHITLAVLGASACAFVNAGGHHAGVPSLEELFPLVVTACGVASVNVLAACGFAWVWAGRRRDRLRREAPLAVPGPGAWRFGLYLASLMFWPVGIVCIAVLASPAEARVGSHAFRLSLANLALTALAVCVAIPVLLRFA